MAKFLVGDVVRLKSGGLDMTVLGYTQRAVNPQPIRISNNFTKQRVQPTELMDTTKVKCMWFDGTKLMTGQFEEDWLEKVLIKDAEIQ